MCVLSFAFSIVSIEAFVPSTVAALQIHSVCLFGVGCGHLLIRHVIMIKFRIGRLSLVGALLPGLWCNYEHCSCTLTSEIRFR